MVHEGVVNGALDDNAPVPAFLGSVEVGEWFGLAFADVDGRLPATPWNDRDLDAVIVAVDALALPPAAGIPHLSDMLEAEFLGWANLSAQGVDLSHVEPGFDRSTIGHLADHCASWADGCPPEALVHADIRADNLLIKTDTAPGEQSVLVVDWANAGLGPAWFDLVFMIPSISMQGGPTPSELWRRSTYAGQVDEAHLDALIVAVAGYFTEAARRPPVAEIPMLRDFQEAQGAWARHWVTERLDL